MILNLLRLELSAVKFSESKCRYLLFWLRMQSKMSEWRAILKTINIYPIYKDVNINIQG
jgi:hypothetical protein